MTRIYHRWEVWEDYPGGFYETVDPKGRKREECEVEYARLLSNLHEFKQALKRVITEWEKSCQHNLSNEKMNRIAWLGQASLCIASGIPAGFRSGFARLSMAQQDAANLAALESLNEWLIAQGEPPTDLPGAGIKITSDVY